MKETFIFITGIAALTCLCLGSSLAGWQWMNPQTTNKNLNDVWGASLQELFFVGDGGVILHWDGVNWQAMNSGVSEDLRCLWGFSTRDVLAGGAGGVILHWDGVTWSAMNSGTSDEVVALWGSSPCNVWAVAYSSVLHWDGQNWSVVYTDPDGHDLHDVWGLGPEEVYVVGRHGILLRWDGTRWQDIFDLDYNLNGVWASASNDLHVVGSLDPARMFHWDGTRWEETLGGQWSLKCIWGVSAQEVYCSGGVLFRWNGTHWIWEENAPAGSGIGGIAGCRVFSVGSFGYVAEKIDGVWTQLGSLTSSDLRGTWAASPEDAFVVGADGTILHFDGVNWDFMDTGGITSGFADIWGTSPYNVFAVGGRNIIHYDGTAWTSMECPIEASLHSIHGISSELVFAVGGFNDRAIILRFDGATWTQLPFQADIILRDVWVIAPDCAVAVGWGGLIARWDGTAWTQQESTITENLQGVWGSSPDNVIAVGHHNTAVHWDGARWCVKPYPGSNYLYNLWGSAPDDVYAVGGGWSPLQHEVMHWDGFAWSSISKESGRIFYGCGPIDTDRFLAVGQSGGIALWDGEYPLGVRLSAPVEIFQGGDLFGVRGYLDNPGPPIEHAAVFFAVRIQHWPDPPFQYWFWPGWMEYNSSTADGLDYRIMSVPHGSTRVNVVTEFAWPADAYLPGGFTFYGAMLDPESGELLGELAATDVFTWF